MIREQSQQSAPLSTLKKLVAERYSGAKAVFWCGSVSRNEGTVASDLDLVIVFETLDNAYREAFLYEGWPIDAFIHNLDSLGQFFELSRSGNGIPALINMVLTGVMVIAPNDFSERVHALAKGYFEAGPAPWQKNDIDKERFLITDTLHDVMYPASRAEQVASAAWLFEALGQFYFRAKNKWCGSLKSIVRYLVAENPDVGLQFTLAFEKVFVTGETGPVERLTKDFLEPYGGLLWDGFHSASKR